MKRDQIKKWLDNIGNDELKMVYLDDGQESLINPNMGYALRDEIFEWQDKLDDIDYSEEGFIELYLLTEDILDTLEVRMALNPAFIKKIEKIHQKIESGDTSDFVKVDLPKKSFFDLVNDYCDAKKIGEIVQASEMLISYVTSHIKNVECSIYDGRLWIKSIGNASCSASILSYALDINAKNKDDGLSLDNIWSIHLHRR